MGNRYHIMIGQFGIGIATPEGEYQRYAPNNNLLRHGHERLESGSWVCLVLLRAGQTNSIHGLKCLRIRIVVLKMLADAETLLTDAGVVELWTDSDAVD